MADFYNGYNAWVNTENGEIYLGIFLSFGNAERTDITPEEARQIAAALTAAADDLENLK